MFQILYTRWQYTLDLSMSVRYFARRSCYYSILRSMFCLAVIVESLFHLSLMAQDQDKFSFSTWKRGIASPAFEKSHFRVKTEAFRKTSDNSGGMGKSVAMCHYEIYRRNDYCRITLETTSIENGVKSIVEQCFTDQFVHLQGNNRTNPALEPVMALSGCLDVIEAEFYPTDDAFGPSALIFGIVGFSGDWKPRLAEFEDEAKLDHPAMLDFGPIGKVRVHFQQGFPQEIEHTFNSFTRDKASNKVNRLVRNLSETNTIRYSSINWKSVEGGGYFPNSYNYDQYLTVGGKRESLVGHKVTVEQFEFAKSFSNDIFIPKNNPKTGTAVSVSDVPVACEWRNNRIQPVTPSGEGTLGFVKLSISRIVFLLIPSIVLSVIAFFLWKRRTF